MKFSDNRHFYFGLLILLIPYVFWFVLGEDSYINILDNLDSELIYIKLLLESEHLFGFDLDGKITQVMGGLDRSFFRSGLNFTFLIFSVFPPAIAYIFHHMVVHLIGYIGMFLLLKRHVIHQNDLLCCLISLCFGFLSYYHIQYGISISGQPLLLFSFLNLLHQERRGFSWVVICLFPFFSFLPVTLPFFVPVLLCIGYWYFYTTKSFPFTFFIAICIMAAINVLIEFNLVYSLLASENVSHRIEWNKFMLMGPPSIEGFVYSVLGDIKRTQYHAGKLFPIPILLSLAVGSLFKVQIEKRSVVVLTALFLISMWVAFNKLMVFYLGDHYSFLKVFNSERFYFMMPFLWLLLLSLTSSQYDWRKPLQKYVATAFVVVTLIGIVWKNHEISNNLRLIASRPIVEPTFRQFYSPELFKVIKEYIGPSDLKRYNFLSVGFFPSISQYNGLKSLDSYQNNYPLSYKHAFEKIIRNELKKNLEIHKYFKYWGSRCYAFSSELGMDYFNGKSSDLRILNLDYDLSQFELMDGKYILSTFPIALEEMTRLRFHKHFSSDRSYLTLYLYELD